jgi:two-component system chemotaxis sensor kinase CheA
MGGASWRCKVLIMDELLRDFLTETHESIDVVDVELVRFEQEPNNAKILGRIFRLVHTIKGTCGFLSLPRLERLTHAAETLIGNFRDGAPVTSESVSLILATIDRIKHLLDELEHNQVEQAGDDRDLIGQLERAAAQASGAVPAAPKAPAPDRPASATVPSAAREAPAASEIEPAPAEADVAARPAQSAADERFARKSIRVHVDTLEQLMTMVSELVLTRNQLLEIVRRHEDSEFKAPLQRLSNVTA